MRKLRLAPKPVALPSNGQESAKMDTVMYWDKIAYCGSCGAQVTKVFHAGQFVIVRPPGERPYFARVISAVVEDGQTLLKLSTNENDTQKINIRFVDGVN